MEETVNIQRNNLIVSTINILLPGAALKLITENDVIVFLNNKYQFVTISKNYYQDYTVLNIEKYDHYGHDDNSNSWVDTIVYNEELKFQLSAPANFEKLFIKINSVECISRLIKTEYLTI